MELTDTNQPCGLSIFFDYYSTDCPTIQLFRYSYDSFIFLKESFRGSYPRRGHHRLPGEKYKIPFCGGHSEEDPPVPIPNTEVKLFSADGTARETVWESRSPPLYIEKAPIRISGRGFFFLIHGSFQSRSPDAPCWLVIAKRIHPHPFRTRKFPEQFTNSKLANFLFFDVEEVLRND